MKTSRVAIRMKELRLHYKMLFVSGRFLFCGTIYMSL